MNYFNILLACSFLITSCSSYGPSHKVTSLRTPANFIPADTATGFEDSSTLIIKLKELDTGFVRGYITDPSFYIIIEVYKVGSDHWFAVNDARILREYLANSATNTKVDLEDREIKISMKDINYKLANVDRPKVTEKDEFEVRGLRVILKKGNMLLADSFLVNDSFTFPTKTVISKNYYSLMDFPEREVLIKDDENGSIFNIGEKTLASLKFSIRIEK
jgi:hypothetical protein